MMMRIRTAAMAPALVLLLLVAPALALAAVRGTAPSAACTQALVSHCDGARMQGVYECGTCGGKYQQVLLDAGCGAKDIAQYCGGQGCTDAKLDGVCGAARANGSFVCAECLGANNVTVAMHKCSLADQVGATVRGQQFERVSTQGT